MSSTSRTSETRTSRKRKLTGADHNSGYEAGLSLSPASELYANCSDTRLPHKKRRKEERPGLHLGNAEDVIQMFRNDDSSTRDPDCREVPHFSKPRQVTLTADDQPSSYFEELLFGLISENECSQVCCQNRCTADVDKCTREEDGVHGDTSSDSSYTETSHVSDQTGINSQCSERFGETGCVLNSRSKPSATESAVEYVTTACSVDSKTDHLNLPKKQNKDVRYQKLPPDYAKLCEKSDCREPKLKKHIVPGEKCPSSINQFAISTNKRETAGKTGAVYGKTSTQTTAEEVRHCLQLKSDVETVLCAESSTCDVPKSSRKHKKHGKRKKNTENNSHSAFQEQKRHLEHRSSLLRSVCSNSDRQTVPPNSEHCSVNNERMIVENHSIEATVAVDQLGSSFSNVEVRSYDEGRSSELTPCKKKSKKKKKKKSEFASPSSVGSESNNATSPVSVLNGTTDELLGNDLPDVCGADLSENISVHMKSSEGGFEQLLMNILFDDKSAKTNHSDNDKNCGEELEAFGEKFTSSDSSSDDDFDNVNVVKEHTPASSLPVSSWNDSASNKVGKLKDNMMSPVKFEGEVKKSQDCSMCSLNRSPSLLDNTLLRWLDCDLQSPIGLDNVSDINCSSALDQTASTNKSV